MITESLGIADDPIGTFLFLTISGYSYFLLLASAHYAVLFKWKRARFNPDYHADPRELRRSLKWSFFSICGNAVVTAPIHVAIATGHSRVYWDVSEMGWGYLALSVLVMLVFTETLVYWAHRILHMGPFYRHLHRHHHSFHQTNPYMAVAFHPLDSFMQALPHHLFAFLVPVHIGVYLGSVMLVTAWSVIIHDRLTLVRASAINYTEHHDIHHWYYDYNYGQYTTFWDRLCRTYRSPRLLWPPKEPAEVAARTYDPLAARVPDDTGTHRPVVA